jgi:hypothetical protein
MDASPPATKQTYKTVGPTPEIYHTTTCAQRTLRYAHAGPGALGGKTVRPNHATLWVQGLLQHKGTRGGLKRERFVLPHATMSVQGFLQT